MYPDKSDLNYQDDTTVAFFSLPYEAFNNWSAHQVKIWGKTFPTAEHAFQYAKFKDTVPQIADKILNAASPWHAFQLTNANRLKSPKNWPQIKVGIMTEVIVAKVNQHQDVTERLLSTGDRQIIENSPWDKFWGIGPNGDGRNELGKIYMRIRDELRTDTN